MTVQTLINRAFRKIQAVAENETPSDAQAQDALADLNDMLAEWWEMGIEIDNGDLSLTDTFPIDKADQSAVMYGLCERLLGEYPSPVGNMIIKLSNDTYKKIHAKYKKLESVELDDTLTYSQNGYNILIDS